MHNMFEALGVKPEVRQFEHGDVRISSHSFKIRRFSRLRVFTAAAGDPARATVICVMHGYHRNAADYRDAWAPLIAGRDAIVIAPRFSRARFESSESYNLGNVIDEVGRRQRRRDWTFQLIEPLVRSSVAALGGFPGKFRMYGHSAGAQFVHRYVAFMPDASVERAVAANAGWYLMPRRLREFPYGLRGGPRIDLPHWLGRDLRILVGSDDVTPEFRRDDEQTLRQGMTRIERAKTFHQLGQEAADQRGVPFGWSLEVIDGVGHDHLAMSAAAAPHLLGG